MKQSNIARAHEDACARLSDADCRVLVEALDALLRERSCALRVAAKLAEAKGGCSPDVSDFGLPNIIRLSRVLSCGEG